MRRKDLCILDFDGVMINSGPVYYGSVVEIFKAAGITPVSLKVFSNQVSAGVENFYLKHGLIQRLGLKKIETIRDDYLRRHWHEASLNPYSVESLQYLKYCGIRTMILSNNEESVIKNKLEENNLMKFVEKIFAVPDKETVFQWIINSLKMNPEQIIYADDCEEGILKAKKYGIITIGFTNGYNTKRKIMKAEPDFPRRRDNPKSVNSLWMIARIAEGAFG